MDGRRWNHVQSNMDSIQVTSPSRGNRGRPQKGTLQHKNYTAQGVFWHSFKLKCFGQKFEFWGCLFLVMFGVVFYFFFNLALHFFVGKLALFTNTKTQNTVKNGFVKHPVRVPPSLCWVSYSSNSEAYLVQNCLWAGLLKYAQASFCTFPHIISPLQ